METCMHTHHQNMHKHIGNMCCVVMRNVHGFIFKVQNNTNTIRILSPPYVLISINTLHVVLCMVDALSMKRNSTTCVRLLQMQLLLQKCISENILFWWSCQLWKFIKTSTFLKLINLHFTYHMYALLEWITIATHADRHSSVVQISNMCCAVVIMHNMGYPYLHTKFNLNNMVVISLCLFKT